MFLKVRCGMASVRGSLSGTVLLTVAVMLLAAAVSSSSAAVEERPLMRYPDIHRDLIAFVHGEDIWSVSAEGGVAQRLTIDEGDELHPRFSPDGSMIAFTGEYDGNGDVYVMNVYGGEITRVTYHPSYDRVVGWHPQKNKIVFASTRKSFQRFERLFMISPDGTGLEELILYEAAHGSFSPDGKQIAYNRVRREHRTWKRYVGGLAQEVFIYNLETDEDRNISNFDGTDRLPMWIGDKIYFSSDRERVLNIFSYDTRSGRIEQVTRHTEYDVRRPSMGGNKIVYELGGQLWVLDVTNGVTRQVEVQIRTDTPEIRPYLKDVSEYVTQVDCSPSGARALVVARGEVFTVPKEHGPTRNLTHDCGSRDKDAVWSPDGKSVAYFSDKRGEYELYVVDAMGDENPVRLTEHSDGYRHTLRWSPDSKMIAFADQTLSFFYVDVKSKKVTRVDKAEFENVDVALDLKPIHDFSWSPDSRWLAYSKMDENLVLNIHVYSLDTGKAHNVSYGIYNDFNPVFSKDGEHLFFISNRRFEPTYCDFEWEMVYKDVAGIYCLTLKADGPPLLPFRSDEEEAEVEEDKDKKKDEDEKKLRVVIDFDGITHRIEALPLDKGNYRNLGVNESALFYRNKDEGDFNFFEYRDHEPMTLYAYDFEDREERTVIEDIHEYNLSADGEHVVYRQDHQVGIIEASATDSEGETLDLSDLQMWFDPRKEWAQIYNEAWRMERDFYYEPGYHGLDWDEMKEKYGKLLPYASCRQDLRYIVGELIGELNTSHTYVFGGDDPREADAVTVGLLGVDWEVDENANRYRFKKIYRTAEWSWEIEPPLLGPGIDVREGDYLLEVNGVDVTADRNIYSYFQNLAGEQVTLVVNDSPRTKGAREATVEPTGGEYGIRYIDWMEHNRMICEKESDGQIGYLHLPDTYNGSAVQFPKYFYAQTRKKGLIVDGRFNGGGLDPDIFLQRLNKNLLTYWTRRYSHDQTTPAVVTRAHMVCLTNRQAGSGGDMLPMEFQMHEMGPVIGTRSWGGLVGVSMWIRMIDGGGMSAPDYRIYDPRGRWIVENVGVEPDIVVDLHSAEMARGHDAQLMKGIEVLMEEIRKDPLPWPEHEAFPVDR
jgi:tricorn protease